MWTYGWKFISMRKPHVHSPLTSWSKSNPNFISPKSVHYFLTEVAVQNLCNHSRSRNKEQGQKGEPISYKYETDNGSGMSGPVVGPFWGLADICLLCPRPSGIQACTLFILPLAPRAHTSKYADRWMDITMQIVSS